MTESSNTDGTWLLWIIAILIVSAVMAAILNSEYEAQVTHSCMDAVQTPNPEATDYDRQSLEFSSDIRKCLRA